MRSEKRWLATGMALLLGVCGGCGTRGYEDRLEETVKRLGQESVFAGMNPAVQLAGTQVTVQLPGFLGESPLPADSGAQRLAPPSIEVPDLKLTFEGAIVDTNGGRLPIYCYLAATAKDPQEQLRGQFQSAFSATVVQWEEVDCKTPDGGTSKWKRVRGTDENQEFYYVDKEQNSSYVPMPTTAEFYFRQEGDLFVVIGWRMPRSIENLIGQGEELGLDLWARRVAGSVGVKQ